jgi:molybdate transport system substrate-binding protein
LNNKHLALALFTIIACASGAGYYSYNQTTTTDTAPVMLRVFIASSLINVVNNMTNEFNTQNHCKIILNSAGSNSLYQQIISGSLCDVFMAADFKWTEQLDNTGLLLNSYQNFTKNKLEVLVSEDNLQKITTLLDLVKPDVKIVIADASVPVGSYTNTTLNKIDSTWGNASSPLYLGLEWENYRSKFLKNVVSYEVSVEDVVGKVSLGIGTVDVGVAFVSDATYGAFSGAQLRFIQVPAEVNTVGTYGIAIIDDTNHADLAQKFVDFWTSNQGQTLLKEFGFGT